jgi:hypothetical protein
MWGHVDLWLYGESNAFATVNPWLLLLVKYPQRTWRNGVHYNQERQITDMVDQQTYNDTQHKYAQANP